MKIKASELFSLSAKPNGEGERTAPDEAAGANQRKKFRDFSSVLGKREASSSDGEHARKTVPSDAEESYRMEKTNFRSDLIFAAPARADELLEESTAQVNAHMNYSAQPLQWAPEIEEVGAKPNFPAADVERIVNAIETRCAIDGKREVTLEFSQAIAQGLVVKLSSDPTERLRIEFIAPNARLLVEIKSQLPELINQLRARGVDTAHVKVSINCGGDGHREKHQKRRRHNESLIQLTTATKTLGAQHNADIAIDASARSTVEPKPASATYHA